MMMKKLTNKQWQVFKYLAECSDENGNVQSSIRKVQKEFGYKSPNTIFKHILALKRKGWVKKTESGKVVLQLPSE